MKQYLKLLRVRHYIKNFLVFAALLCSGQFFTSDKLLPCILGFLAFCAVSSAGYIVNDIRDAESDRLHPVKCTRPIASGAVPVKSAWIIGLVLLVIAAVCNGLIFQGKATVLLALYFVLNLAYSFGLKNIPIVDIAILVSGFLIRILYGALITDITISNWLYLTVITLAFYFALGKRRNELQRHKDAQTRNVLRAYSEKFLDKSMGMCLTLANAFYALWSMADETMALYKSRYLVFTVPIVLLISFKYSMNIEGDSEGDPVDVLLHDKWLILLCVLYLLIMFGILYF